MPLLQEAIQRWRSRSSKPSGTVVQWGICKAKHDAAVEAWFTHFRWQMNRRFGASPSKYASFPGTQETKVPMPPPITSGRASDKSISRLSKSLLDDMRWHCDGAPRLCRIFNTPDGDCSEAGTRLQERGSRSSKWSSPRRILSRPRFVASRST